MQRKTRRELNHMMETLLSAAAEKLPGVYEGIVMSHAKPYRRLDCDGRALAYCRVRTRRGGVRIDVSGLWIPAEPCIFSVPGSTGAASLFITEETQVERIIAFLKETLERTRATYQPKDAPAVKMAVLEIAEGDSDQGFHPLV